MIAHTELANVARVVQGGRHGLSGNHFVPEGYPAYGAGGLNGYLATYEFDEPAVVLSAIGARCGKCFPASGKWSSLANTQVILPDPAKVDARFLWYQLNDELSWPRAGTAQPFIKPLTVKTRKVYLPPLPEQRRIADILDRADAVRRKRKQAIALTEELLRSTFLEMFGDPVSNPKGWAVKTLDKLVETATGGTPSRDRAENFGGDIPWVKTTVVRDEVVTTTEEKITAEGLASSNCTICPKGTIIVAMYGQGATRGRTAVLGIDAATNQACAAILTSEGAFQSFLWTYLRVSYERLRNLGRGGTQPNLNLGLIRSFPVPVPPHELQSAFQQAMTRITAMGERQARAGAEADALFSSLVHRAFRGELTAPSPAPSQLDLWPSASSQTPRSGRASP